MVCSLYLIKAANLKPKSRKELSRLTLLSRGKLVVPSVYRATDKPVFYIPSLQQIKVARSLDFPTAQNQIMEELAEEVDMADKEDTVPGTTTESLIEEETISGDESGMSEQATGFDLQKVVIEDSSLIPRMCRSNKDIRHFYDFTAIDRSLYTFNLPALEERVPSIQVSPKNWCNPQDSCYVSVSFRFFKD
jgi:hypothetical protein